MIKAAALFGHPEDPDAFEEYYTNTHLPLVRKIPNLQRFDWGEGRRHARRKRAAVLSIWGFVVYEYRSDAE